MKKNNVMKNIILLIAIIFVSVISYSQDSTGVSITDSTRMYRYTATYAVINYFDVIPPGLKSGDATRWTIQASMKIYASKTDYTNGKPELFGKILPLFFTSLFPTKNDILTVMRQNIK
jgi:hypothetical protein